MKQVAARLVVNREGCKYVLGPCSHQLLLSLVQEEEEIDLVKETSYLFNNSLFLNFADSDKTPYIHTHPRLNSQEPGANGQRQSQTLRAQPREI